MQVILCAYHWAGCVALKSLLEMGHDVAVFTHEALWHIPDLAHLANKLRVEVSYDDISGGSLPFQPDVICSIYYRNIIRKNVIDSCGNRIFNLHPSLLPRYRGCSSVPWAIINGEHSTGYTYHYIDEGCDTGDIIIQHALPIHEWDTQLTLYYRIMFEAMKDFPKAFNMVVEGKKGVPQSGQGSYHKRGCPHDCRINAAWSHEKIERFIRAMIFPPYPCANFKGLDIRNISEFKGAEKVE